MGRQVSVHSRAIEVVYLTPDFDDDYEEFTDFIRGLQDVIEDRYHSFKRVDYWEGRENHVILENSLAKVSVAEYCGLVSVSLVPSEDPDWSNPSKEALNENWTRNIAFHWRKYMEKSYGSQAARKIGSFSNGEGVYERVLQN